MSTVLPAPATAPPARAVQSPLRRIASDFFENPVAVFGFGLLVLAIFANRLASALKDPKPEQIALLIGVGVAFMLFIWLAQRLGKRFAS